MRPDNVAFFLTCSFLPYLVVGCSSPGAGRRFPSCGTVGAGALHFQGGRGDCACSQGGNAVFNPHATLVSCLCLWGRHGLAISSHPRAGAGVGRSFVCSHSAARGDQRYSQDWERVPIVTCDRAVSGDRWVA